MTLALASRSKVGDRLARSVPDGVVRFRADDLRRFEAKWIPEPNSGCWLWIGAAGSHGYGNFFLDGRTLRANRASLILYRGLSSQKSIVCHRCDNPACVNPEHLFEGTYAINSADCVNKGRYIAPAGERNGNAILTKEKALLILGDPRTYREIGAAFHIHHTVVALIKAGRRWKSATKGACQLRGPLRGESNPRAKLSAFEAAAIFLDMRKSSVIAREYGVSRQSVYRIRAGRNWSNAK